MLARAFAVECSPVCLRPVLLWKLLKFTRSEDELMLLLLAPSSATCSWLMESLSDGFFVKDCIPVLIRLARKADRF